jgi:hypothetical protein
MWSCSQCWLKRFFAIRERDCCYLLREAVLLADNTRLLRAAAAPFEAQAAILRGFGARLMR